MREFQNTDVLAVIVSYNCTDLIIKNVESLTSQVDSVIIIDNGSSDESLSFLGSIEKLFSNCKVIYGKENKGIAKRLNEGLQYAKKHNKKLILTMDQDTVLASNCISEELKVLNKDESVASVGPKRAEKKQNKEFYYKDYLITSGSLSVIGAIDDMGGYREALGVDMVDIDFSLSLRNKGYRLAIANKAEMEHQVGELEESLICGKTHKYLSHSPQRFYSIYKNAVIIQRVYGRKNRLFCVKLLVFKIIEFLKIIMEKDFKTKYKMALGGIKDGMRFNLNEYYL